jgi:hypothetical protein
MLVAHPHVGIRALLEHADQQWADVKRGRHFFAREPAYLKILRVMKRLRQSLDANVLFQIIVSPEARSSVEIAPLLP